MVSQIRDFFKAQPPKNFYLLDNMKSTPTLVSPVQREEVITNSSRVQPIFSPKENVSCAKQELQALWDMFTSWLQPDKQSKEQMISQLVLEQFLKIGHCKDNMALKQQWESSGRNIGRFMEGLTDECLKPPVLVHVCMQGQEAIFSENMSLKEVIKILKEQQSGRSFSQENSRSSLLSTRDRLLATGHKNNEECQKCPWNNIEVNDYFKSPENEMNILFITQKEQVSEPIEVNISDEIPLDYSKTDQISTRYKEISQRANSSVDVPTEEKQKEITSRSEQSEQSKCHDANFKIEGQQERPHREPKTYRCDECPRTFKYPSQLLRHQTVHRKKRSFFCTVCHKGFFSQSKLQAHEVIHKKSKVKTCGTCGKTFSHKTNLQAHKRIHTGEKPYKCSLCDLSFRQSYPYKRHLRNCHQSD